MAGAFRVYAYPIDSENPEDIAFELQPDFVETVPEDQEKLKSDVERALAVISAIYSPDHGRFKYYHTRLVSLSQMGLVGNTANPATAQRSLQSLLKDFADKEGAEVKRRYLKSVNSATIWLSLPVTVIAFILMISSGYIGYTASTIYANNDVSPVDASKYSEYVIYGCNFLLVWSSCIVGIWLSSVAKAGNVEFNRFHIIEEWQINPITRFIFISAMAIFMSLLVYKQFVVLSIGGISLSSFYKDPVTSIIFGVLCGLGERLLSTNMSKQAENLFSGMK